MHVSQFTSTVLSSTLSTIPNKIIHLEQLKNYSFYYLFYGASHIDNEGCGKIGFPIIERVIAYFILGVIALFDNNYIENKCP